MPDKGYNFCKCRHFLLGTNIAQTNAVMLYCKQPTIYKCNFQSRILGMVYANLKIAFLYGGLFVLSSTDMCNQAHMGQNVEVM